jgi:hypothetical protein
MTDKILVVQSCRVTFEETVQGDCITTQYCLLDSIAHCFLFLPSLWGGVASRAAANNHRKIKEIFETLQRSDGDVTIFSSKAREEAGSEGRRGRRKV